MAKITSTKVFVNGTGVNPGGNHPNALVEGQTGKGVGELPGKNRPYMTKATENTNPMQKHDMIGSGSKDSVGE